MTPVTINVPESQLIAYIENDYASESQWMRIIDDSAIQLEKRERQSRDQQTPNANRDRERGGIIGNRNGRRP